MNNKASERQKIIAERLTQALSPMTLEIIDESHRHVGHEGAKGGASHFALLIVSSQFEGLSAIKRHQLIYQALQDLIPHEIHALKIKSKTPEEWSLN